MEETQFLKFEDGDVMVHLSLSKRYRLHSNILRQHSPVLKKLLNEKPAARLSAQAKRDGATPYVLELRSTEDNPQFVRMELSEGTGRVKGSDLQPTRNTGLAADDPFRFWDWLFGAFYKITPEIDDDNLGTIVTSVMGLSDHATILGSIQYVREFMELSLIRQDKVLWHAVLASPWDWVQLAERIYSPTIYQECVCHIVGRWQALDSEVKEKLSAATHALCAEKYRNLYVGKEVIEIRICGHYPQSICYSAADKPGRPQYSSDIYMWMCLSFFRQWYCQAMIDGRTRNAQDGGYQWFKTMDAAGDAYLKHVDFQEFHQYFPMSAKACSVLEQNMTLLKEDIKSHVRELMVNHSHVVAGENGVAADDVNWLTCSTPVRKEEFPWYKPDDGTEDLSGGLLMSDVASAAPGNPLESHDDNGSNGDDHVAPNGEPYEE